MKRYIKSSYLYPDFDTAYNWDQEEVREEIWFDCDARNFLSFDEVLSIAGKSTGLYRLKAKHEANTDVDRFIKKYLSDKHIYPIYFDEAIDYIAEDFENSPYNSVTIDEGDHVDAIKEFVYSTYAGITLKVKQILSDEDDWWYKEVLNSVSINYNDGHDWSEEAMLKHGADMYATYGPGNFDDMNDYDYESHQAYQKALSQE